MSILDIGSGIRPMTRWDNLAKPTPHICVEPHYEYADWIVANRPDLVVIRARWQDVAELFPANSVDHIVLCDVIEHVDKDEALRLIDPLKRICRIGISIVTPMGFMEQSGFGKEDCDPWGFHGMLWQKHRSGWTPDDFPGWRIVEGVEDGGAFEAHYTKGS